jgi:D-alanyl-D-alanine carboxypeptidase/D-alanyl-D-alanine-endopeptidase (penicillin-binding protein 4)
MQSIQYSSRTLACMAGIIILFASCTASHQIKKSAQQNVLNKTFLSTAHIGICLYDADADRYLYNYQSDKFFVPASNTKLFTCYAAMKYLGDSIKGLRYLDKGNTVDVIATGDPTFLYRDFSSQKVLSFLNAIDSNKTIVLHDKHFKDDAYGDGWAWNDYTDDYMQQRSALPIYGNTATFEGAKDSWSMFPSIKGKLEEDTAATNNKYVSKAVRDFGSNHFHVYFNGSSAKPIDAPFYTDSGKVNAALLQSIIKQKLVVSNSIVSLNDRNAYHVIYSQPLDSMLKIMMHRSDNFYAEQSLLMVSNEQLGLMNDDLIIDTLLKTDYKDLPQHPKWVDGSGLSRYNLISPQDFVFVLNKMRKEFNWNRITTILPTGGTGTLGNYYKNLQGKIFAKTGSLSNVLALSGYLITQKHKTIIFSIIVNNYIAGSADIRKSIEAFLTSVQED